MPAVPRRAATPADPRFRAIEALFKGAEHEIALIDRTLPLNAASECARLRACFTRSEAAVPSFRFAEPPDLTSLRRTLERVAQTFAGEGVLGRLYAERAIELELEARAVEVIGTPLFAARAQARFPLDTGPDGARAAAWAKAFVNSPPSAPAESLHPSDALEDPRSLISVMRREVGRRRLPFRVELSKNQLAAAVTGEGFIGVRAGVLHSAQEAARIALHEIEAHALPRARARSEALGLCRVGTRGSGDEEEGRAILIERRGGFLNSTRRRELGRRHIAAVLVRKGASFAETVEVLLGLGTALRVAVDDACRAHRGGGLGREYVYLVALSRVERALEAEPELERWLTRGRISLAAARELRELYGTLRGAHGAEHPFTQEIENPGSRANPSE